MAVVQQKEGKLMTRGLGDMLGQSVTVDGCHVGYVENICVEQYEHYGPIVMQIKVRMTNETLENVREYEYIQQVMGGEEENEARENHI